METVTHDGRATAYRVQDRGGSDTPVLFVHGSGGTHAVWKSQLARLSGRRPVAALDLSGHGDSEDVDTEAGPETLDAYVEDVRAVAAEVDAGVLVGNSLGGAVVFRALLDADANTDAITNADTDADAEAEADTVADVDAAVFAGSGAKLTVLDDLRDWLAGVDGGFDRAVEFLHREDMLFHDPSEEALAFSKRAMRAAGREVVERDFLSCHDFDVRDRLDEVDVPVLALTGEYDRLTPPDYHEYVAEHVQNGVWTTIDDAAHLSMLETPGVFNDAVSEFLVEHGI